MQFESDRSVDVNRSRVNKQAIATVLLFVTLLAFAFVPSSWVIGAALVLPVCVLLGECAQSKLAHHHAICKQHATSEFTCFCRAMLQALLCRTLLFQTSSSPDIEGIDACEPCQAALPSACAVAVLLA